MEKVHNVGLANSKTPSQIGSFQGQQVTVTVSLYAVGVNVRERQLPRPTEQCLTAFQGVQAQGTAPLFLFTSFTLQSS